MYYLEILIFHKSPYKIKAMKPLNMFLKYDILMLELKES